MVYTIAQETMNYRQSQMDGDFAGCPNSRQSTFSNIIFSAGSPISWCSLCIRAIVPSTFAAEYIGAIYPSEQIQWLRELVEKILPIELRPSVLGIENQGEIGCTNASSPTK